MSSQPLLLACSPTAVDPHVQSPSSATGHNPALYNESIQPTIQPADQSFPKGDPACGQCTAPMTQRHLFDKALGPGRYAYGEIIGINESVHAPIEQILTPDRRTMPLPSTGSPSRTQGRRRKGPRPGVVLTIPGNHRRANSMNGTKTMLLATFSGIHKFDNLPRVLRHFCMPVSPHSEIGAEVEHLHTTPEWQRDHAWLILHPIVSSGTVSGRWRWKDKNGKSPKECSFKLDGAVLSQMEDVYNRRFKEWSANCLGHKGLAYLQECVREYKIFKQQDYNKSKVSEWIDEPPLNLGAPSSLLAPAKSSIGGSPLLYQASLEPQDAPARASEQVEPRANEDAPSPPVLPPQPLPDITDVVPEPPIPRAGLTPSHSRHTSASGRLIFGDTVPLDLDPANRLGVNFGTKIEDWLSRLEPLPGDILQGLPLPLRLSGEPSLESESEGDWETTSAATTESVHDDAELVVDMRRAALKDATITSPPEGAPAGVGVDGPAPTEDNNRASPGAEASASTSG
ncbi:hypothetical protein V8D89_008434 [Ganoderma adspersum]